MIAEIEQRLQDKVLERSNAELRGALIEAKESIEGMRKLNTLDNLIVELKKGSKL